MNSDTLLELNEKIQEALNKLPIEELIELTASKLHDIWVITTYIKDEHGNVILDEQGNPKQVEKWKKIDPEVIRSDTTLPEAYRTDLANKEQTYMERILSDERFFSLPFIRKEPDGKISIDIGKMKFHQLSPSWQEENREAAEAAVELTLDNYALLASPEHRKLLASTIGSAIHYAWKKRPRNVEYARTSGLGNRFANISKDEQAKDVRHIFMAENAIAYIAKKLGVDQEIEKTLKTTANR